MWIVRAYDSDGHNAGDGPEVLGEYWDTTFRTLAEAEDARDDLQDDAESVGMGDVTYYATSV